MALLFPAWRHTVDKSKDRLINGGPGFDRCRIDAINISQLLNCERIIVVKNNSSNNNSDDNDNNDGADGQDGTNDDGRTNSNPSQQLNINTADGLVCSSELPLCSFTITGDEADNSPGIALDIGGLDEVLLGTDINLDLEETGQWVASGLYGCTESGSIKVNIGEQEVFCPNYLSIK